MVSEGRLELPAFAFVARCDDPISLLRRRLIENGGVYGIRTREIPDRQSGGVDHWPNTPKWRKRGDSNAQRVAPHLYSRQAD